MVLLSLVVAVPAAFVVSLIYCAIIARVVRRRRSLSLWLRGLSILVLVGFAVELVALIVFQPAGALARFGWGFEILREVEFVLGLPALANALVLRPKPGILGRWYVAPFFCASLAYALVVLMAVIDQAATLPAR